MRYQPPVSHRAHARAMRKDATRAENLLWQALRRSRLEGLRFRRQYPLDGYILDFVCFRPKLIVEVDGGQHSDLGRASRRPLPRLRLHHPAVLERRHDPKYRWGVSGDFGGGGEVNMLMRCAPFDPSSCDFRHLAFALLGQDAEIAFFSVCWQH